tara:strand:+ start:4178 stop:4939 length:762 start_codon:yes stop_codon:yes gene_type:complete
MKKRLIGLISVKKNLVVQSFNYSRYLPLGSINEFVENLNRWSVDEILISDIERSKFNLGPNFDLLKSISKLNINTPIIYAGNIRNVTEAITVIKNGADRLVVGNLFLSNLKEFQNISKVLGSQAIILSLSCIIKNKNIFLKDYVNNKLEILDKYKIFSIKDYFSEILLIDCKNEGYPNSFDLKILNYFNKFKIKKKLILFGGISETFQIDMLIKKQNISAIALGNFLNYKEHAYQNFLENLKINKFRKARYSD